MLRVSSQGPPFVTAGYRYPVVERAVSDMRLLSDPTFAASISESVNKILMEDRNKLENPAEKMGKQAESLETSDSQGGSLRFIEKLGLQ